MSILNVNKINPVGGGSTVTIAGIASVTSSVTAPSFVGDVTGNVTGTTGTFSGDVSIADKIVHTGDTNTAIRFSGADTITAETGGSERLRIDSNGHTLPGADNTSDLGSSSKRWRNIYSADLQLSNVGTGGNEVDGTEGKWTLQEAEDTVYMINRITGKRYKIKMEEV
tara:strand:+ start:160 stop:663 length:504 start_codon:yes stop_codon:yes gene_type:complete